MKKNILLFVFTAFLLRAAESEHLLLVQASGLPLRDKENVDMITEVTVLRQDAFGRALEVNERTYLQCRKCNSPYKQSACSCSYDSIPSIEASMPVREPLTPNRCGQACAACISCPQACWFVFLMNACEGDEEAAFNPNSCHEKYVGPFDLPPEYEDNECCINALLCFPCFVPQVEAEQ